MEKCNSKYNESKVCSLWHCPYHHKRHTFGREFSTCINREIVITNTFISEIVITI